MFKNLKRQIQEEGTTFAPNALSASQKKPCAEVVVDSVLPTVHSRHVDGSKYENLERTYDDYRAKATALLTKKDAHITRLQSRVSSLEARLELVEESDKINALLAENRSLEHARTEFELAFEQEREHWARKQREYDTTLQLLRNEHETKLTALMAKHSAELQRGHVTNSCEDCVIKKAESDGLRQTMLAGEEHLRNLQTKLTNFEETERRLRKEKAAGVERVRVLEEHCAALEDTVRQVVKEREKNRPKVDQATGTSAKTMEIRSEQHMTDLANEVEDLQIELDKKHRDLTVMYQTLTEREDELKQLKEKAENFETNAARQRDIIESLRDKCDKLYDERKGNAKGKDELILYSATLSHEIEDMKKEREAIVDQLAALGSEMERHSSIVRDLEAKKNALVETVNATGGNARLAELERRIAQQDEQLKTQVQRFKMVQRELKAQSIAMAEYDVNFQYTKNLFLKFISAEPGEASQLIRAVTTLLHLSTDEETALRETLRWKISWLPGTKPRFPAGTTTQKNVRAGYS